MGKKTPTDPPRIFISYSRQDAAIMLRLEERLKAAGAEVWVDHAGIRSGDNLPKRISDALEWCNILLLLWSGSARKSKWVEKEWTNADALDRRIIPCLLEKIPLPGILTNRVFVDFRIVDQGFEELLSALNLPKQPVVSAPVKPFKEIARVIHSPLMDSEVPVAKLKPPQADFSEGHQRFADQRNAQKTPPVVDHIEPNTGKAAKAGNVAPPSVQRKRKLVAWIAVLLVSVLSIVIYSIQTDKSEEPSDASTTLDDSSFLSSDSAKKMIIDRGFYDNYKNPNGKGIVHQYKLVVINGDSVVADDATKLTWQQSGSANFMTYANAEKYVRDLNNKRFAGYNDWRLPTLEEAMSLMEREKHGDLFIDTKFFDSRQEWIWTADKGSASAAWLVSFGRGFCDGSVLFNVYDYSVRAVR